jgi:hypothetical protein
MQRTSVTESAGASSMIWLDAFEYFRGRESERTTPICNSLLRADRDSASSTASERTATIRCHHLASLSCNSKSAPDWLHADGDQATLLWVSRWDSTFGPLAEVEETEDCRTRGDVGAHPNHACPFRTAGEVPLHGSGGVRKEDVRQAVCKELSESQRAPTRLLLAGPHRTRANQGYHAPFSFLLSLGSVMGHTGPSDQRGFNELTGPLGRDRVPEISSLGLGVLLEFCFLLGT